MTDPFLRVEMRDGEIVIAMVGTNYQVTFRELADFPGLSASHNIRDDPDAPITRHEFLAAAWEARQREGEGARLDRVGRE
jgi:hypothetical protein